MRNEHIQTSLNRFLQTSPLERTRRSSGLFGCCGTPKMAAGFRGDFGGRRRFAFDPPRPFEGEFGFLLVESFFCEYLLKYPFFYFDAVQPKSRQSAKKEHPRRPEGRRCLDPTAGRLSSRCPRRHSQCSTVERVEAVGQNGGNIARPSNSPTSGVG